MSQLQDLYASDNKDSMPSATPLPPIGMKLTPLQTLYASDTQPQLTGQVWPDFKTVAKPIAEANKFPLEVLLGQSALESARGAAAPGNNYFGIKALPGQASTNQNTQEYGANGYYGENDAFAAYPTPQDSIKAYIKLVTSYPGVKEAMATGDKMQVLQAIRKAGYATSPTYVQDVANTPEFQGGNQ